MHGQQIIKLCLCRPLGSDFVTITTEDREFMVMCGSLFLAQKRGVGGTPYVSETSRDNERTVTLRLLMSYYMEDLFLMFLDHTTTQHSR